MIGSNPPAPTPGGPGMMQRIRGQGQLNQPQQQPIPPAAPSPRLPSASPQPAQQQTYK